MSGLGDGDRRPEAGRPLSETGPQLSEAGSALPEAGSPLANPPLVSWWWRGLYVVIGLFFVGLGLLGAYLPVLPTTPFLLLASYFLLRSWPALNQRIQRIPVFGRYLRDWNEKRGVRREVKILATVVCLGTLLASLWLAQHALWVQVLLAATIAVGMIVVWSLPTIIDET